jgi:predicted RNA-binding Zn-ribbon protein involved in translation (DUF1610 family)
MEFPSCEIGAMVVLWTGGSQFMFFLSFMHINWGKKVSCPACSIPFYDRQKSSLSCPQCGYSFERSELHTTKGVIHAMVDVDLDDSLTEIAGCDFHDEGDGAIDLVDDSGIIGVGEELEEVKVVD